MNLIMTLYLYSNYINSFDFEIDHINFEYFIFQILIIGHIEKN